MKGVTALLLAVGAASQLVGCSSSPVKSPTPISLTSAQLKAELDSIAISHRERQLRWRARADILGALTPDHQQLISQLVGQLAVAQKPDVLAAAQRLDRALTPKERRSILAANSALRRQWLAVMDKLPQRAYAFPGSFADMYVRLSSSQKPGDPGMMVLLLLIHDLSVRASMSAHHGTPLFSSAEHGSLRGA